LHARGEIDHADFDFAIGGGDMRGDVVEQAVKIAFGIGHARTGNVNWACGALFAAAGVTGALGGSTLGRMIDGQRMLVLFALLMLVVAAAMVRGRGAGGQADVALTWPIVPRVFGLGLGTGALAGFFGIGGGFLIVPALIGATRMPIYRAIGTSLIAVCAFSTTTAVTYGAAHLLDWPLASTFIAGGIGGTIAGTALSRRWSAHKGRLNALFATGIVIVACYMLYRSYRMLGSAA